MATVYKIEVETVSEWVNYPPEHLEKMLKKFFEEHKDEKTGHGFVNTEVKAKRDGN